MNRKSVMYKSLNTRCKSDVLSSSETETSRSFAIPSRGVGRTFVFPRLDVMEHPAVSDGEEHFWNVHQGTFSDW